MRTKRLTVLAACLLLTGCHSEARRFFDGGGYQKMRKEERAEEHAQRQLEWTRKCEALFVERRRIFDRAIASLQAASPRGEEAMTALRDQWRADTEPVIAELPHQCSHEPQKQKRAEFEQGFHADRAEMAQVLVAKAIEAQAPRVGRTLLHPLYNQELNQKRPLLEQLARELARQYDADLLKRFTKYGGYGKLGATQDQVGCAFSETPWPESPGSVVPGFTTHVTGKGKVVHALCRLPLPASGYVRPGARFAIQLLSQAPGSIDVASSFERGTPESLGESPYVTGTFELPPNSRFDHSRFFFDVRVLLVTDGGSATVLSQSSFSWQATP